MGFSDFFGFGPFSSGPDSKDVNDTTRRRGGFDGHNARCDKRTLDHDSCDYNYRLETGRDVD